MHDQVKRKRLTAQMFFPLHPQWCINRFIFPVKTLTFPYSPVDRLLIKHDVQCCRCTAGSGWGTLSLVHIFADRGGPSAIEQMDEMRTPQFRSATWRDSPAVCAFADEQRHLGHIVRAGKYWLAFDATHPNSSATGFRLLGSSMNITVAKRAVEQVLTNDGTGISRLQ